MFDQIRFVLVNTSHPGNIGSAARAIKTMGFDALYLVSPQSFPHDKAKEMATGASDILDQAIVVDTLADAIFDCNLVVGTSVRMRTIPWPIVTPRQAADKIRQENANSQIAVLFGREQTGLTNQELQCCHLHVQIPTDPTYCSLNIAHAVQVIAYELRLAFTESDGPSDDWDYRLATMDEMERFFVHLQQVLIQINFLKMEAPRKLMTRLRRLFFRTRPDIMEMNILRGMLTAIEEQQKK